VRLESAYSAARPSDKKVDHLLDYSPLCRRIGCQVCELLPTESRASDAPAILYGLKEKLPRSAGLSRIASKTW